MNVGNAISGDVLGAEGKTPAPQPSFPVVTGAANLAAGLTGPGGIGELPAAETAASVLPNSLGGPLAQTVLEKRGIPNIAGAAEPADVLGNNINPDHLPADTAAPIQTTYDQNAAAIDAGRRGVVSNQQTVAAAQDLANATGDPVQQVIQKWQPGDVQNASMMTAVRNSLAQAQRDAQSAADLWASNPTPTNQMVKMQAQASADRVQAVVSGLTAELGRGLQAMGIDVTDPLVVRQLADNQGFVASLGKTGFSPADLPAAIGNDGAVPQGTPVSGDVTAAKPQEQDFLPGMEPPQIGGNTVQANAKPFTADAAPLGEGGPTDPNGFESPVWWTDPPDFGAQGPGFHSPIVQAAVKGVQSVQNVLKQTLVSLSLFHPLVETAQLARTFLSQGDLAGGAGAMTDATHAFFSPDFLDNYMQANKDDARQAEATGTTLLRGELGPDVNLVGNRITQSLVSSLGSGLAGYGSAKAQGENTEDALKRAGIAAAGGAAAGLLAKPLNEALWGRMVPVAKLEAWKLLEPKYGGEAASTAVNNIFGGQNLAALGRSQQAQTLLRMGLLAPDWLESWGRNVAGVAQPGPVGDISRRFMLATLGAGMTTLEALNVLFNGHTTADNEPGKRFQLETTGLLQKLGQNPQQRTYQDVLMLGPLGSALNAADKGDPGSLVNSHLNVIPSAVMSAKQNVNPATGKQIVAPGTPFPLAAAPEAGAAASHVVPIGLSGYASDSPLPPGLQVFSGLTGMRASAGFTPKKASPPVTLEGLLHSITPGYKAPSTKGASYAPYHATAGYSVSRKP
jgi:hypothetical protein